MQKLEMRYPMRRFWSQCFRDAYRRLLKDAAAADLKPDAGDIAMQAGRMADRAMTEFSIRVRGIERVEPADETEGES